MRERERKQELEKEVISLFEGKIYVLHIKYYKKKRANFALKCWDSVLGVLLTYSKAGKILVVPHNFA